MIKYQKYGKGRYGRKADKAQSFGSWSVVLKTFYFKEGLSPT